MSKIFTYSKDYKDGFKAAYILGATQALAQIHRWEQEELRGQSFEKPYPPAESK